MAALLLICLQIQSRSNFVIAIPKLRLVNTTPVFITYHRARHSGKRQNMKHWLNVSVGPPDFPIPLHMAKTLAAHCDIYHRKSAFACKNPVQVLMSRVRYGQHRSLYGNPNIVNMVKNCQASFIAPHTEIYVPPKLICLIYILKPLRQPILDVHKLLHRYRLP